jgi:hypothetical protein
MLLHRLSEGAIISCVPRIQERAVDLLRSVLPNGSKLVEEVAPPWLVRPGQVESGDLWQVVVDVYQSLTGAVLPEEMLPRERRRLDAVITYADGRQRVLEIDERQHFTSARLGTFDFYDGHVRTAFDIEAWRSRCNELRGRESGGGFARPCPPLFPGPGGRHRQRAFRDFLADALPVAKGWLPTMRISDAEVRAAVATSDPPTAMAELARAKELAST